MVLLGLIAITVAATVTLRSSAKQASDAEAEEHLGNVASALSSRIDAYDELLLGLRGAYTANRQPGTTLSHEAFEHHMRSLDFNRRFPGVQVIGIAPLIDRHQLVDHTQRVNVGADRAGSNYPVFVSYPETDDDLLLPISFVFPIDGNESALGLDFFSEANRRGAAERARDTGEPAATAPITLVQETASQQAFLVMVPLYDTSVTPSTVTTRREAFVGVVYAAFRMGDLVNGVIDFRSGDELEITSLRSRTSLNAIPADADQSSVIFSTAEVALTDEASRSEQMVIDVDGQRWGLVAQRDFDGATTDTLLPYAIFLGGFGLIALLSATMSARIRAERANRAKSDFLSRMSHELRTPLNAVIGFSQLLQLDHLQESQRASVRQIEVAGEHLLALVNDVLEISRIEAGAEAVELEPVDLRAAAHGVMNLLRTAADEGDVEIRIEDESLEHHALGDERRVRQALLNLFSNAIKYNRRGGSVTVVLSSTEDKTVRCEVRDTGIGITPAQQSRLFQPFDRLNAAGTNVEGVGLGLMVTKKLIEEMSGTLDVRSTPGEGSSFLFELAAGAVSAVAPPSSNGERIILYIEDEPSNQLVMQHVVAPQENLKLLIADDAPSARRLAASHAVDVVIVGAHVNDTHAETIIRQLRAEAGQFFAVLLVGPDDAEHRQMAEAIGASTLFTLPMNAGKIRALLSTYVKSPVPASA